MAIVGGGGNVGGASFSITGDDSELRAALERSSEGFATLRERAEAELAAISELAAEVGASIGSEFQQAASGLHLPTDKVVEFGRAFGQMKSGLLIPESVAQGFREITEAADQTDEATQRVNETLGQLGSTDAPEEVARRFSVIPEHLEEAINALGQFSSELAALASAAPITRVIPSDEVRATMIELREGVQETRAAFGELIPGETIRQGITDISALEGEVRILERAMKEGFLLPPEGVERLETLKRLIQEIADEIGLVREVEAIPVEFDIKIDALREARAELRALESIEVAPEFRSDELVAAIETARTHYENLLDTFRKEVEVPPVEIELRAPNLDEIVGAIGDVQNRLGELTRFEIDPAFRTDEAHAAIDALETHLEQLQARAQTEITPGESIARSFDDALSQLERVNGELLNLQLRFSEAVPPEFQIKLNEALGEVDRISQLFSQPIEFGALLEGVRSAEDFLRILDLLEGALVQLQQAEIQTGGTAETQSAIQNIIGLLNEGRDTFREFFPREAIAEASRELKDLERTIKELASSDLTVKANSDDLKAATERAEELKETLGQVEETHVGLIPVELAQTVEEFRKADREAKGLSATIKEFEQKGTEAAKKVALELREVAKAAGIDVDAAFKEAAGSTKQFASEQERLLAELNALRAEQAKLIPSIGGQTAFERDRFKQLGLEIGVVQQKLGGLANAGGVFGRTMNSVNAAISRATLTAAGFGLKLSDIAIVLGAGFAGGIAGVIQVALQLVDVLKRAAQAVFEFSLNAAQLGSQFESLISNIEGTFGSASDSIRRFADTTALAFGVSRTAALQYLNSIGQLLQSYGLTKDAADEMAIATFAMAKGLRQGQEATTTFAEAQKVVKDILSGNLEAARAFNFTQIQEDLEKIGERLGINTKEMDSFTRGLLGGIATAEEAMRRLGEAQEAPATLNEQFERTKAVLQDVTTEIGGALLPVFKFLADMAIGFAVTIKFAIEVFKEFVGSIRRFFEEHQALVTAFKALGDQLQRMVPGLTLLAKALGFVAKTGQEAQRLAELQSGSYSDLEGFIRDATEALLDHNKAQELTIDELKRVRDAHQRLNEAIEDGAEKVKDAVEAREEAIADAADRTADAQKKLAKAYRERAKAIADALENIKDIEEDNRERISDAIESLADAQEAAAESIQDAEEKLQDARIDGADRVRDAERQLHDARMRQLDQLLDARLSLEKALREGDAEAFNRAQLEISRARRGEQVNDAQQRRAEAVEEAAERIKEAEEALAEAREDAAERVEDAQKKLARTVEDARERMKEAEEKYAETVLEQNERVKESEEALVEAREEGSKRVREAYKREREAREDANEAVADARENLDEINADLGTQDETLASILDKLERELTATQRIRREREKVGDELRRQTESPGALAGIHSKDDHPGLRTPVTHQHGQFGTHTHQQHGGRYYAGQPYIVGEDGPELRIPGESGLTISNAQLIEALREMAHGKGGDRVSQHVTVNQVANDPDATAFAVASRLLQGVNN